MDPKELEEIPRDLRIWARSTACPIDSDKLFHASMIIEELRSIVADCVRSPLGVIPASASWLTQEELKQADKRREDRNQSKYQRHE